MGFDLHFLGASGTVTGSKFLVTYKSRKILVDCGLFQGLKALRLKNWDQLPVEATYDLCKILLPDSAYLMEEEADYLNRTKRSKHKPALPLFNVAEADHALTLFKTVPLKQSQKLFDDIHFELQYAGHILGAASVVLTLGTKKITFTGDVGRMNDRIFNPPATLPKTDYLVTESTYGNRLHNSIDVLDELEEVINNTFKRGGTTIIPAFAVGRAQAIMYYLSLLRKQKRIPHIPTYLNTPMGSSVNTLMKKYMHLHKLNNEECADLCSEIQIVKTPEESKALNERKDPMIIISASGMLSGGRVLHHLKAFAPNERNTILLSGYQAAGTRGDALMNGATEIKIHGEYVDVKAQVKILNNISAHADYKELIEWFKNSKINPKRVFIAHGEPAAADELRRRLEETFKWNCYVPSLNEKIHLE